MARGGVQTPPRRGAKPAVGEDGSAGAGAAARAVARRGRGRGTVPVLWRPKGRRGGIVGVRFAQSRAARREKNVHIKKEGGQQRSRGSMPS